VWILGSLCPATPLLPLHLPVGGVHDEQVRLPLHLMYSRVCVALGLSSDQGPDDWTPYNNCLQFEVANFLFHWNQMSSRDINFMLNLWAMSLAIHNDEPLFL
jgi:hypothetical protein